MDLSCLPLFARPVPGESVASWMMAIRARMDMSEAEWLSIVGYPTEAEVPGDGSQWLGLPSELGDVRDTRRRWRITQEYRGVICPACVEASAVGRTFTLAAWVDARQFWCRAHQIILLPGDRFGFERLSLAPRLPLRDELFLLREWVDQWMQGATDALSSEHTWRADLVRACAVNWLQSPGPNAGSAVTWELSQQMLMFGERAPNFFGLVRPAFRQLPPGNRIGVLLAAFRLWQMSRDQTPTGIPRTPELTVQGWRWLTTRHSCRNDEQRHQFAMRMLACLSGRKRVSRR